jgi:hypothetical protein
MTEKAQMNHDDDDDLDVTLTLKDWLEIIDGDVDEAVECLDSYSQQMKQLVSFLRTKADEIAAIEPLEDGDGIDEQIERDEETEE